MNQTKGQSESRPIVLIHPSAETNAADRTLLCLLNAVDPSRWRTIVVLPRYGPLVEAIKKTGATVEIGPVGSLGDGLRSRSWLRLLFGLPPCLFFLFRVIRRHGASVVHTHTFAPVGGAIAAKLFAKHHIWHVHETLDVESRESRRLARAVRAFADEVACGSESAKRALEALEPQIEPRTRVIRNAIDRGPFALGRSQRDAVRKELNIYEENTLVLTVGRIEPSAGQKELLEAVRLVRRTRPDVRVVLVGDPSRESREYVEDIDDQIERGDLEGVATRIAYRRDLTGLYAAADIVCIPGSAIDPFHIVPLEALAAGKPVVAPGGSGAEEYVEAGTNGLIFERGDVQKIAWCIELLASDEKRRLSLGASCEQVHTAKFQIGRLRNEFDRAWSTTANREFHLPATRASVFHVALGKSNPNRLNGVNHVVHHMAAGQVAMGINATVIGITQDPEAKTTPRPYKTLFFKPGISRFRLSRDLVRLLNNLDTTAIVHLHGAFLPEMWAISRILRRRNIPYVVTPHGAFMPEALEHNAWAKRFSTALFGKRHLAGARSVQVMSGRELLNMEHLCLLDQLRIVPNGQTSPPSLTEVDPQDASLLSETRRPVFAYCGRLSAHTKGLDALLDGFARHVARRGEGDLWIVGDGKDREALESQATDLGLGRRIKFFGAKFGDEKRNLIASCDAFVHPSRHEGMPTAVLEAGSLGVPLVVSEGTNLDGEVRQARAGFVLAEVSPDAIADALADVCAEHARGELAARRAAAHAMVFHWFSWERICGLTARDLYGLLDIQNPDQEPAPTADAPSSESHQSNRKSA